MSTNSTNVEFYRGEHKDLSYAPKTSGAFVFTEDEGRLYVGDGDELIPTSGKTISVKLQFHQDDSDENDGMHRWVQDTNDTTGRRWKCVVTRGYGDGQENILAGITSNDNPIADVEVNGTTGHTDKDVILKEWSLITRITTQNKQITLYAVDEYPLWNFYLRLKL